jgi:hypothetical protein
MAHGIRYNLSAQAYSNLRLEAAVSQNSLQPGAILTLRASLTEYGIPVDHRAGVRGDVERPDGSATTLILSEIDAGLFGAQMTADLQGVYRFRLLASGVTMRGVPFTREQLLSAAVVLGGDQPSPTSDPSAGAGDKHLCELIECLLKPEMLGRFLLERHVNVDAVRACIEEWCKKRQQPSDRELREREGGSAPSSRQLGGGPASSLPGELIAQLADIVRRAQQ